MSEQPEELFNSLTKFIIILVFLTVIFFVLSGLGITSGLFGDKTILMVLVASFRTLIGK